MKTHIDRVARVISEFIQMDDAALDEDTDLTNDLGLDSLELSDIALTVEEEFDVIVEDEALDKWKTIGDICDFLEEHVSAVEED